MHNVMRMGRESRAGGAVQAWVPLARTRTLALVQIVPEGRGLLSQAWEPEGRANGDNPLVPLLAGVPSNEQLVYLRWTARERP